MPRVFIFFRIIDILKLIDLIRNFWSDNCFLSANTQNNHIIRILSSNCYTSNLVHKGDVTKYNLF